MELPQKLVLGSYRIIIKPEFELYSDEEIEEQIKKFLDWKKKELEKESEKRERYLMASNDKKEEPAQHTLLPPKLRHKIGPLQGSNKDIKNNNIYNPVKLCSNSKFEIINGIIYMNNNQIYYPLVFLEINKCHVKKDLNKFNELILL